MSNKAELLARADDRPVQLNRTKGVVSIIIPSHIVEKLQETCGIWLKFDSFVDLILVRRKDGQPELKLLNFRYGLRKGRLNSTVPTKPAGRRQQFRRFGPYLLTQAEAAARGLDWDCVT